MTIKLIDFQFYPKLHLLPWFDKCQDYETGTVDYYCGWLYWQFRFWYER